MSTVDVGVIYGCGVLLSALLVGYFGSGDDRDLGAVFVTIWPIAIPIGLLIVALDNLMELGAWLARRR